MTKDGSVSGTIVDPKTSCERRIRLNGKSNSKLPQYDKIVTSKNKGKEEVVADLTKCSKKERAALAKKYPYLFVDVK